MTTPAPNPFAPAVRAALPAKAALVGVAGSGKTLTMLIALHELAEGGKVAVIDTENRTSTMYADDYPFDLVDLGPLTERWNPQQYIDQLCNYMLAAQDYGYAALGIDSFSHAWDAILRIVDLNARGGNSWSGWAVGTPQQQRVLDTMLSLDLHTIVTMRARTEWVQQEVNRNGRTVTEPTKVGMGARQREGVDYEFQLIGNIDLASHEMSVEKSRARLFADAIVSPARTVEFWRSYRDWLATGADLASQRQITELEALVSSTKAADDDPDLKAAGRAVRDAFRDYLGGRKLAELTKAEAGEATEWLAARIAGVAPGPDGSGEPAEAGTPDESGQSEPVAVELPEGCTGELWDEDDGTTVIGHRQPCPVHPGLFDSAPEVAPAASPTSPEASPTGSEPEASPPAPSSSPAGEAAAPSESSSDLSTERLERIAAQVRDEAPADEPGADAALDPTTEDAVARTTLWPPLTAVARFAVLLGWGYGTDASALTDEVLVHAAQTAYDPTWPTDGATEKELTEAVHRIVNAAIDAADQLHPEQPAARELVQLVRERWADPQPAEREVDVLAEDDEPEVAVTVDPRPKRSRTKAAS